MNNKFYLNGFLNLFNINPDFVIPVFKKKYRVGTYFVQYISDNIVSYDEFPLYELCKLGHCSYYALNYKGINTCNLDLYDNNEYYESPLNVLSSNEIFFNEIIPIYAFQISDKIVYGTLNYFTKYLNDFKTKDKYLIEQINDFKEYTKLLVNEEINIVNNDSSFSLTSLLRHHFNINNTITYPAKYFDEIQYQNDNANYLQHIITSINYEEVEALDKELRQFSCYSQNYKKIIKMLYLLLYSDELENVKENKVMLDIINDTNMLFKNKDNDSF